jgi:hypothetical protein
MGKKGAKGCQSLKLKSKFSKIVVEDNAVGTTVFFPVYDYYTDEEIGTSTGSTTAVFFGGELVDCVGIATFNLGYDASLEFPFEDQIMLSGTCFGSNNAITGGTGEYACASGYEEIFDSGEDLFAVVLTICNTCT